MLGVVEIADLVGLHKSSVSRLMVTLETEGLVEQDPLSKKYRLALGLLSVAGSLLSHLDVRRAALPILRELTADTQETSSLMLWDGTAAVSVEQVASPLPIKHSAELGTRYDDPESSCVRVFLAELPDDQVSDLLSTMKTSRRQFDELRADDKDCVSVNVGQSRPDEIGVCAGVRDHRDEVVAAVLISAPRYRADVEALVKACRTAADDLTTSLGGFVRTAG
ncbi:IclR family transcriptional regulator [Calidifontibacter terrae]